ncbi:Glycosyl transferases group 1 [Butyrivibrio proteoclasticus]|uniref:Glycosyl transferases group 1 n=1 Tax=Butyrivibrio proteoclasticus TaxID=43305 RepID=A0A1I5VUS1_9FIRM|nr:glycosyltransferase [Butyrivibrio proteoclasticus]SFQ11047.1 Glycosyl transferases group 1 [Butyrivibrio proteoclasticus]
MSSELPILVFKGDSSLCYGILTSFSEQLRDALISLGEDVIYVDPAKASIDELIGKKYKAIIAFMENTFYSVLDDGSFLFDSFYGPKFNYWTDYPAFYYRYVQKVPKDYYILTQDRNYVNFINRYYRNLKAFFLPPGGRKADRIIPFNAREYDLSFAGSFLNWEDCVKGFNSDDETTKIIVDNYLEFLVTEPDYTTEEAFRIVLERLGAHLSDDQFVQELSKVHRLADRGAARLYRQEIIQTILNSGITLDVFGDSWKNSPFADNEYLRIHPEVSAGSVSSIYENSKMSLNIMTWHKDSITERVLDAMMAGSIAISDYTPALDESFENSNEILLFSLKNINMVPDIIQNNIDNALVAQNGCKKAMEQYSWDGFAKRFLYILNNL